MSVAEPLVSRNGWLWWKELRMLAPLVGLLIGVALLLMITSVFLATPYYSYATGYTPDSTLLIALVFPCLFAAGAGAILVGQERDLRTVDWMTTLPIVPRQWILVKFLVAMIGLGVMWALATSCLMAIIDGRGTIPRLGIDGAQGRIDVWVGYAFWIIYSVYLMLCGFYTSWRIRNQFHAIIGVLALAFLPLVISALFRWLLDVVGNQRLGASDMYAVAFRDTVTAVLIPTFAILAYRAAMTALLPQSASVVVNGPREPRAVAASFWSTAPMMDSSSASMIWQSIRSAPLALGLTMAIFVVGFIVPLTLISKETSDVNDVLVASLSLLVPLGMSWLGVLVFQNDGSAERVRYLADRGVSPTRVYLARHAVPLAALATCLVLYAVVASVRVARIEDNPIGPFIPSLLTLAIIGWVMYSVSQWTSQLFRTLTLSVIVSPIVAGMMLAWFVFAMTSLRTPVWMLGICSLLPMIATWWLMPRFMDMRDRPHSYLVAVGIIAVTLTVPVATAVWTVLRVPRIPSSVRGQWLAEGEALRQSAPTSIGLTLARRDDSIYVRTEVTASVPVDRALRWIDTYRTTPKEWMPVLADLRARPNTAGSIDKSLLQYVFNRLMLERLNFERTDDWEAFSPWVTAASQISSALRRSRWWRNQDFADVIEIWIVDTLRSPSVAAHQSDQAYQQTIAHLPDKRSRNASRREAVLASWARQRRSTHRNDFIMDRGLNWLPPYLRAPVAKRRTESIVQTAISALGDGNHDDWLRRMHDLQMTSTSQFEYGPYAPRLRNLPAIGLVRSGPYYPARFWGMEWEDEAERLIRENSP